MFVLGEATGPAVRVRQQLCCKRPMLDIDSAEFAACCRGCKAANTWANVHSLRSKYYTRSACMWANSPASRSKQWCARQVDGSAGQTKG